MSTLYKFWLSFQFSFCHLDWCELDFIQDVTADLDPNTGQIATVHLGAEWLIATIGSPITLLISSNQTQTAHAFRFLLLDTLYYA